MAFQQGARREARRPDRGGSLRPNQLRSALAVRESRELDLFIYQAEHLFGTAGLSTDLWTEIREEFWGSFENASRDFPEDIASLPRLWEHHDKYDSVEIADEARFGAWIRQHTGAARREESHGDHTHTRGGITFGVFQGSFSPASSLSVSCGLAIASGGGREDRPPSNYLYETTFNVTEVDSDQEVTFRVRT